MACLNLVAFSFFSWIAKAISLSLFLIYSFSVSSSIFTNLLYSFFKSATYLSVFWTFCAPDCDTTTLLVLVADSSLRLLLLPDSPLVLECLELVMLDCWVFLRWLLERESDLLRELLLLLVGVLSVLILSMWLLISLPALTVTR